MRRDEPQLPPHKTVEEIREEDEIAEDTLRDFIGEEVLQRQREMESIRRHLRGTFFPSMKHFL